MKRVLIAALSALLLVPAVAPAQVTIGGGSAATFLFRGDETIPLGEVFASAAVSFDITESQSGQIATLFGASANSGGGKSGGLLYRHFFDFIPGNSTKPGLSLGAFVVDNADVTELAKATLFLGGGLCLDIRPSADGSDAVLAFAEVFPSLRASSVDGDPLIVRFGVTAAFN